MSRILFEFFDGDRILSTDPRYTAHVIPTGEAHVLEAGAAPVGEDDRTAKVLRERRTGEVLEDDRTGRVPME